MNAVIETPYCLSPNFNKNIAADLFSACCVIEVMYQYQEMSNSCHYFIVVQKHFVYT